MPPAALLLSIQASVRAITSTLPVRKNSRICSIANGSGSGNNGKCACQLSIKLSQGSSTSPAVPALFLFQRLPQTAPLQLPPFQSLRPLRLLILLILTNPPSSTSTITLFTTHIITLIHSHHPIPITPIILSHSTSILPTATASLSSSPILIAIRYAQSARTAAALTAPTPLLHLPPPLPLHPLSLPLLTRRLPPLSLETSALWTVASLTAR